MQMRRWIAATLLAATLAAGWFARDLAVDNRLERWLGERGEAAEGYEAFRRHFGSDEFLLVAIDGGGFFEAPVLDLMLDAAEKLEAIPGVIQVRGIPTFYRDLFGGEDPQALEEELISTPFYRDLFISGDGDLAGILLQVDPGDDRDARSRIVRGAQEAMHPLEMEGRKVSFVGSTALIVALDEASKLEARRTLPVAFVGSLLVLALMLRSVRAMIVTGASALVSVVLILGFAAVVDLDLNMVSTALPPLLWVLALSNSIHIVRRYQDVRVETGLPAALRKALADTTRPCTLASVTTAAGFASLAVAVMAPIRELGALAAFGILLSLAVNLTVVPLLIEWLKVPSSRKRPDLRTGTWRWGWKVRPGVVVAGAAVVLAAAIVTIPSIEVESDPVGFLPKDHPTTQAYRSLAGKLGGFYTLELVLTAPDQWFAPSVWPIIQSVADRLAGSAIVSRVMSPVDVLRKLNHWESDFDPAAYRPPATREEAEELVGSASGGARRALRELALDDNRSVRLSALVAEMEENRFLLLEQDAREVLGELPEGWRGVVTGQVLQLVNAQQTLVSTQVRSLGIALCLVFGVMAFGLRSWSLTLTAVLPNLVPLVVAFSLMAALRIPLDAATVMVASIALGIAVDNTVHVLENIRRRGEAGMSTGMAIEETLRDIGPALAATTATACAGFLALCTSDFMPIRAFGLLAAASMTAAFLADVVLLPAILMLRQR